MSEIRWTDKVYLDSQGNIRSSDGCPTDQMTQDTINKINVNIGLAKSIDNREWAGCGNTLCRNCEKYETCMFAPNFDDILNKE
jgi:hypothetical protein